MVFLCLLWQSIFYLVSDKLSLDIIVKGTITLVLVGNKGTELFREFLKVVQMMHTKTRARGLGRVSWTNSLAGGTDAAKFLKELLKKNRGESSLIFHFHWQWRRVPMQAGDNFFFLSSARTSIDRHWLMISFFFYLPRPNSSSLSPSIIWWTSKTRWALSETKRRPVQSRPIWINNKSVSKMGPWRQNKKPSKGQGSQCAKNKKERERIGPNNENKWGSTEAGTQAKQEEKNRWAEPSG